MLGGLFERLRQRVQPAADAPRLNLALQGGGAHGAFTWGVLDALLEDGRFVFATVSGASAGAMNAVVLAHGLAEGLAQSDDPRAAREHAREALRRFWSSVGTTMPYEWLTLGSGDDTRLNPLGQWLIQWTQTLSPRQANPLDINPLRDTLAELVDFERLRRASPVRLLIATTHANSVRLHLHTEREIDLDVLLASACLPMLHHPVMLDGQPHWDGGYTANPPVLPLVFDPTSAADTLLVPLVPMRWDETPTTLPQIRQRLAELTFSGPFIAELQRVSGWHQELRWPYRGHKERQLARARWHVVDGASALATLRVETRLIAHGPFLEHLHDLGRERAKTWLAEHGDAVGLRSTCSLRDLLGE
jgi:NTE family protein